MDNSRFKRRKTFMTNNAFSKKTKNATKKTITTTQIKKRASSIFHVDVENE